MHNNNITGGGERRDTHVGRAARVRAAADDGRRLPRDAFLPRAVRGQFEATLKLLSSYFKATLIYF